MFKAEIANVLGIANIINIIDVADIVMDIANIAIGIADIINIASIADWMLRILWWKQVSAYKVLRGCSVTVPPPLKLKLLRDRAIVVLGGVYKSLLRLI